jgi:lipopolysaccharide/colanic/teichoic acid biosynthesis glycosyltransferase
MTRRLIDIFVSAAALMILAPLLIILIAVIWHREGSPVFYVQRRAGLGGAPFSMFKFRTMRRDADRIGGSLTFKSDPRITPFGGLMRRFKLDELPQLLNVLRGDMTLIGPRPEVLDWVSRYTPEQMEVLKFKPGLSDPVQILFRHEQDFLKSAAEYERLVAIKVSKQIEYLRSRTLSSDLATAVLTVCAVFSSAPSHEELSIYAMIREETQPATGSDRSVETI